MKFSSRITVALVISFLSSLILNLNAGASGGAN
jgi:hypothetical protein